jgi:hypothetical protein
VKVHTFGITKCLQQCENVGTVEIGIYSIIYRVSTKTLPDFNPNGIRNRSKVKVKVTLVQALRLCTGFTAHRGSRGIALLYRH